ncbi:MAG: Kef-type transport system, NAD-binding component [Ilumatobacteraceae bacterium]|nr:Kef-type transport system, NAD-binding component [Ilumatobacteraceae bacterium]
MGNHDPVTDDARLAAHAVRPHLRTNDPVHEPDPRLVRWEKRMSPVIVLAALVPIVVALAPRTKGDPYIGINVVSWLIFLADLIVHLRWRPRYLKTGLGRFDLVIVVLTFPWYLIPGLQGTAILGLARLGRLLRLILAGGTTKILRRLVERIGKASLYSLGLIIVCSEVVYRVEPASSGFSTPSESIWWGFVTFTTVGYGDIVPETSTGRFVSVVLMVAGVALIGLLAGSLAEFLADDDAERQAARDEESGNLTSEDRQLLMLDEMKALRVELADLRSTLARPAADAGAPDDAR